MGHFLYDWFNIKAGWFGLGVGVGGTPNLFLVLDVSIRGCEMLAVGVGRVNKFTSP